MSGYYDFNKMYSDVWRFNHIAGNLQSVTDAKITNQLKLIQEELKETIEGNDKGDKLEILDGICDVMVTALGLYQMLKVQGYDCDKAFTKVNENNLSKYIHKQDFHLTMETQNMYNAQGVETKLELNSVFGVYIVKDMSGKIRKPVGFESVDISDCLPK